MRTAFITGAAGFIGRHLVEALLATDWRVIAFCRISDRVDLVPEGVQIRIGDLSERASVEAALTGDVDTVFHLAGNTSTWARNREAQFRDNVDGTRHVLEVAISRGVRRFVDTSTVSSYGWQPGVTLREDTPSNVEARGDNYGRSKHRAEQLVKNATRDGAISAVILNPVNVVGAYDAANWSQQFILPISNGTLRVIPPGSATWISVHDVVAAQLAAADSDLTGNVILGGVRASFLEVVREIQQILGRPVSAAATPRPALALAFAANQIAALITRHEPALSLAKYRRAIGDLVVDDSLARRELSLGHTPLHDMLSETVGWLRDVKMLPPTPSAPSSSGAAATRVDWVPVADEPRHLDRFRIPGARVYEAVIEPGARTQHHRHDRETLYVVLDDSRFRSIQPAGQPNATRLGRAVGPLRTLRLLAGRAMNHGWMRMPRGTVLMQHHTSHPLIHLVENGGPTTLRMLGIELDGTVTPPTPPHAPRPEYRDSGVLALRLRGAQIAEAPPQPAVVVVVHGVTDLAGQQLRTGNYGKVDAPSTLHPSPDAELLLIYP